MCRTVVASAMVAADASLMVEFLNHLPQSAS
jgi:hypothetical protein